MNQPTAEPHVCRICRRPLEEFDRKVNGVVVQVIWTHSYVIPGTPEHDPDPIPQSQVDDEIVGVCDFCTAPHPTWRFPADNFDMDTPNEHVSWGSVTDWAACDDCKRLIEQGRWRQLANRTLDHRPFQLSVEVKREVRIRIMEMHQQFSRARKGRPPVPA